MATDIDSRTQSVTNLVLLAVTVIGSIVASVMYYTGEQREFNIQVKEVELELKHQNQKIIEIAEQKETIMTLWGGQEASKVRIEGLEKKVCTMESEIKKLKEILTEGVGGVPGNFLR